MGIARSILRIVSAALAAAAAQAAERPNIVVIVADDLGWADVGYHGSPIKTPNIDRLARDGIELERFYVAPVCSPTRTALLTGRFPNRTGMQGSPTQFDDNKGLPPAEITLAEILRDAGYKHRQAIGKWHLGTAHTDFHPINQGFSGFYGHYCGATDYFLHTQGKQLDWHRDYAASHDTGYSTRLDALEAVRFIESVPAGEPFFIYLAFNAVHEPIQAPAKDVAAYTGTAFPLGQSKEFAAVTTIMDEGVGKVRAALEKKGVADNTLIWFLSDNGGTGQAGEGQNEPQHGNKASTFEGGVHVDALVSWPAAWKGGRKVSEVMGHVDLLPTLAAAAGLDYKSPKPLDGLDVSGALSGKAALADRYFFPERGAVVTKRWKLTDGGLLYDLEKDPNEKTDLSADPAFADTLARFKSQQAYYLGLEKPPYYPVGFPHLKDSVPFEWKMPGPQVDPATIAMRSIGQDRPGPRARSRSGAGRMLFESPGADPRGADGRTDGEVR